MQLEAQLLLTNCATHLCVAESLIKYATRHVWELVEFVRYRSNRKSVITEKWSRASRLSGSLKVIRTDTDRPTTCDFLVIHSNWAHLVPFPRKKRLFRSKVAIFPLPCIKGPRLRGFLLEFFNGGTAEKTRLMLKVVEKLGDMCSLV